MRIEAVEPLASLTEVEAELLDELLEEHPDIERGALVVYRMSGSGRRLIALADEALSPGVDVVCVGWTAVVQRASSEGSEHDVKVELAAALRQDDLDR
jgi:hypothetical protein